MDRFMAENLELVSRIEDVFESLRRARHDLARQEVLYHTLELKYVDSEREVVRLKEQIRALKDELVREKSKKELEAKQQDFNIKNKIAKIVEENLGKDEEAEVWGKLIELLIREIDDCVAIIKG
ncbi:MAG: hypothetical protein ACK4R6_05080 [Spirosomataceae bacterium]